METKNRVVIGTIEYMDGYNKGSEKRLRFWGDVGLRAAEFRAVTGCEKDSWGYTLPLDTPQAILDALTAPVYATPSAYASDWQREPSSRDVRYMTTFKGADVRLIVYGKAVVILSKMTVARVEYMLDFEAKPNETGAWELTDRYSQRTYDHNFSGDDRLTDAALREARRVLGGLLAGFLESQPQALIEGRNRALELQRAELQREITEADERARALREQLFNLPADEPLPDELPTRSGITAGEEWEAGYTDAQNKKPLYDADLLSRSTSYLAGYRTAVQQSETQTEGGV